MQNSPITEGPTERITLDRAARERRLETLKRTVPAGSLAATLLLTGMATARSSGGGGGSLLLQLTASGTYSLQIGFMLPINATTGQVANAPGSLSLSSGALGWRCSGSATLQAPNVVGGSCRLASGQTLQVAGTLQVDDGGQASGTVDVTVRR